jgi:hypothetical protein
MSHNPVGLHGLLRGSFIFLYADDVRTSQETPPRPVRGQTLLFYEMHCKLYVERQGEI